MLMVKHSVRACQLDMNYRYYNRSIGTIKHTTVICSIALKDKLLFFPLIFHS